MKNSFQWSIDYDYDRDYTCIPGCDGCYCNCSTIKNLRVNSVNISSIVNEIINGATFKRFAKNKIFVYCVDRVVRLMKLYKTSLWEVNIVSGYYGEEVGDVTLYAVQYAELVEHIGKLSKLKTNKALIEYVLKLEYGFVLPAIKNDDWVCLKLTAKELRDGLRHQAQHLEYVRKVDRTGYDASTFDNGEMPIGIYAMVNGSYRLIDGYHRYHSLVDNARANKAFWVVLSTTDRISV